ncbi:MAG: hypothetical protein ABS75_00550 [Pelagibacterium sp. SCN 63-23]|nr:MAG: hypothetical protein ABS75_00550 [Pelagibacterium sp. SCN 63-23]
MPRAFSLSDYADPARDPGAGEWQALRGELVALLDKVESHYGQTEAEQPQPAMNGLARRVRHLRDQVGVPETASRRSEALRTVKRAVDRFSERDAHLEAAFVADAEDDLSAAIAEIRSRQGAMNAPMRRPETGTELRELGALVGGMSQRLERLEGELKSQRSNAGHVREVASQVEQLTQVVELLAGAVGETGQVKRLEAQIAALGAMIEAAPRSDLVSINDRLDDVSATVGKLAELQAAQMEREIARNGAEKSNGVATLAPAMHSIEESVRNVYDRIDAIERNVALSSGDFERLTSEMAAFTLAMQNNDAAPGALVQRVEALAERFAGIDSTNSEVAALKTDITALRDAVLVGMEPRFSRIESQIEALSGRVDSSAVEGQLKLLMQRMDDASAQLDGLARLYSAADDRPDLESLADMVAERTSEAVSRKAPAPVAMFGPDSLKSIEDRLTGLIRSAGKTPDYEQLAEMVALRTSEAMTKSAPVPTGVSEDSMNALEKRMTAILNTAGKDTAERLARLEAVLSAGGAPVAKSAATSKPSASEASLAEAPRVVQPESDPFREALQAKGAEASKLDSILAGLSRESDAMPANPADDAPLVDPGFPSRAQTRPPARVAAKPAPRAEADAPALTAAEAPRFDPGQVERPPRPLSSFASADRDPFADPPQVASKPVSEPAPGISNTSTFVAAARRAQRARQEESDAGQSNSIIGRALARMRPRKDAEVPAPLEARAPAEVAIVDPTPEQGEAKAKKPREPLFKRRRPKTGPAEAPAIEPKAEEAVQAGFLTRHRRPLLLAATLVAVSMLALNLVMQRMEARPAANATSASAAAAPTGPAAGNLSPSSDQSELIPPRVIDLVDTTATGSINPGKPMSFARTAAAPRPPALAVPVSATDKAELVPAITAAVEEAAEAFALPPEAVGPLALREAAANGNAQAQFEVAAIYGEGRVLDKDLAESASWYERAAAQGFVPAQYRLGNLYEVGSGVEKDLEQARLWYQRGAEAGNRMAMHNLAALYAGGELGDQQFELAAEWFAQAAARGMTDSQFNLGMLYARGLGVDQDFEQSFKWFSLAALSGDKDAGQARDDIAKSLSADAVGRINDAVKAWKAERIDLAANFAPIGTWSDGFDPGQVITGKDVVSRVQVALGKLGFDVGPADGMAGTKTAEAIKAFERATGMSESGAINPRLLAVLGSQPV